ncbi:MFS transporter [Brevibacillus choshinensis]|uniref:MFS transporter n=1 Tax=Brevibacillus choshinensis TaxID=54911 RepID=A0ABR5ND95_BRECH|nr:MFS transporter [Brevibacillus choshinensis]KQL49517.1 MFS transporter [Brevibacillus choshinensis]
MILRNVLFITFGFQIMIFATRPMMTLYAADMGADTFLIGILAATFAFFPLLFAIHAGKIADCFGDRMPLFLSNIGCAVGLTLPFLFPTLWSLFVSQAIVGVSHVFINVCMQNVLGKAATKENRDHYFSVFSTVVAFASFIGPVLGGYLAEQVSYASVFMVSEAISVIPIGFSLLIPAMVGQKKEKAPEDAGNSFTLLKIPLLRKALATSALVLYSRDIYVAYFPLYASHLGISDSSIGWIIAIQGLAMVPVRLFLAKLAEVAGRDKVLLFSILTAGISFLLIPFVSNVVLLLILSAIMGVGLGCGQPLSLTTTYNASPKTRTGEVLGLRLASNRLSQLVAPLFFGVIGSWGGLVAVFYISGAFLLGGAFLTKEKTLPAEVKGSIGN